MLGLILCLQFYVWGMYEELSAWLCRMPVREVKMSSKSLFNKQIVLSVIESLYKY